MDFNDVRLLFGLAPRPAGNVGAGSILSQCSNGRGSVKDRSAECIRRCLLAALVILASVLPLSVNARTLDCPNVAAQATSVAGARSFVYRTEGRPLYLHVFAPRGGEHRAPAIVFFFGGGWRIGKIDQFEAQALAFSERGFVAVLADYRVACRDASTPLQSVADARAAYEWVRTNAAALNIDASRIALSGGSAGGHLALTVSLTVPQPEQPGALILFNPALVDFMQEPWKELGLDQSQADAISPALLPIGRMPPLLVMHSKQDSTIPIAGVRAFCGRVLLADRACTLIEYPGLNHGFFNFRKIDPQTGVNPSDDSTAKAIGFLSQLGWAREPIPAGRQASVRN